MFTDFEIRPVVVTENGTCRAFDTAREARRHLNASSSLLFGLYGQEDDDTWQHVADCPTKTELLVLIENLFGLKPHWKDEDRCTFSKSALSSPVPLQTWCNAKSLAM